ncbi:MAG: efflux RND transporter periplasmic adaptor subunit [Alphaproteobacteria bacterium]|nr:efflux RND transporter periplasmic adaptor subunit [Alphaproteobacteria bacterium]
MKKKKLWMAALLLCIAAAGGHYYFKSRAADATASAVSTVLKVDRGTIEDLVTSQGKLEPKEYVDVGVQVSGQLEKIHVDLGDTVKAGDLIAEIDPQLYESKVQSGEAKVKTLTAQIAQQQAEIKLAGQQHARNEQLVTNGAISREAFDTTETALLIARARLDALNAQMEEAQSTLDGDKANLGYTKIYAPMDGTVVVKDVREGQTLNATQSAPTVVQLANLDTMTVRAQVAEADVMRLKPGLEVYFTTMGSQGRRWTGNVRQILPSPEVINDVVLYNVLVDVDNRDRRLMTGMSTQMFFVLGRAKDVVLMPVAALGKRVAAQDNETGQAYEVRKIAAGGVPQATIVHIGLMSRTLAEVRTGLAEGDSVAAATALLPANAGNAPRGMRGGMPRL